MSEHKCCVGPEIVDAIIRLGRAQELLKKTLEDNVPDHISKHDPLWHSEHEREADLLYDARCKLNSLHDDLWNIVGVLSPERIDEGY